MADEVSPANWNERRVTGGALPAVTSRVLTSALVPATRHNPRGLRLEAYRISAVSNAETWISNIPNIFAVAWQPDVADTDEVGPTLLDAATGEIYFAVGTGLAVDGWVWVLRGQ